MTSVLTVAALGLLFGATHVGLGAGPVRGRLVAALGERGFALLFSVVAWLTFLLFVAYYAAHRSAGPAGPALGEWPVLRWSLIAVIAGGLVLMTAGLARYLALPMALFSEQAHEPRGIERITRHPFFAGLSLFLVAHALLAQYLAGVAFFLPLALLAVGGAWHQDRKLQERIGASYGRYLEATSAVPFAAIVARRQRLAPEELPWAAVAVGLVMLPLLRALHPWIFAFDGTLVVTAFVLGSGYFLVRRWRYGAS